jgi:hypothetical protein
MAIVLSGMLVPSSPLTLSEVSGFNNYVVVYKNGEPAAWAENTMTGMGLNHTRDILMGRVTTGVAANISVIQLSTETSAANATVKTCGSPVTGNGLDLDVGTIAEDEDYDGNYSLSKKWTATGTQASIAKVCLHNTSDASGLDQDTAKNVTFATALLSSTVSVESGDTLNVTWYIKAT